MHTKNRILSLLLAVLMLVTFAVPASAQDIINLTDYGEGMEDNDIMPPPDISQPDGENTEPPAQAETPPDSGDSTFDSEAPLFSEQSGTELEDEAELLAAMKVLLNSQRVTRRGGISLFAAPGDTGVVVHSTISIKPYDVTVPGVGNAYGSVIWKMKINGEDAFCLQIWKIAEGTYTAGEATNGNGNTAKYIANYMASGKTNAEYVAAQVLVWESLYGDIGIFDQSIKGTSFESAYNAIKNASAPVGNLHYWDSNIGGQDIATYATGEPTEPTDPDEPDDPDDPDEPGNPNTHTEVTTETETNTEVRSDTTYEYSDSIGQITIAKRNDKGVSLDGAIFDIKIEFANGETGGDSAFEVYNGSRLFTWTHPADDHEPAKVTVTEVRPPHNYSGDYTPQTATVHPTYTRITKVLTHTITITTTTTTTSVIDIDSGEVLSSSSASASAETELNPPTVQEYTDFIAGDREITLTFVNTLIPSGLTLIKLDSITGKRLSGAVFSLYKGTEIYSTAFLGDFQSDGNGMVIIEELESNQWYTAVEKQAPYGYELAPEHSVQTVYITPEALEQNLTIIFRNPPKPKLTVRKIDEQTLEGIEGVTLRITKEGAAEYMDVTTGKDGTVTVQLDSGWYFVQERIAKPGYSLDDTVHTIELKTGGDSEIVITNRKKPSLKIIKLCSTTGNPLQAPFDIKVKNGRSLGTFTTDPETGEVLIEDLEYTSDPLVLEISELRAPDGYLITTETMEVTINWGENKVIEWYNTPENPLLIYKRDIEGKPVGGTEFLVTTVNGAHAATVKTDRTSGVAVVPGLLPGWYTVRETRTGGEEYILDSTPKQVELKYGAPAVVEFVNDRRPELQILKLNKADNTPMPGVLIRVERMNGERIGDYRTNEAGLITLTAEPGWVTVYELETISGFVLDSTPVNVELKVNKTAAVELYNVPLPGLQLRKTCGVSGKPLAGVEYQINRLNGSAIGTFTTDNQGIIYLDIDESGVIISELKTVSGYKLYSAPQTVELTPGELTVVSYKNMPYPILELVKLDSQSRQPLANVKYKLYDSNMRELGIFTTNNLGRIILTGMDEGKYFVQEHDVSAAGNYVLDKTVHEVNLFYGKTTKIELFNTKMGTLRLLKVCAESGKPLAGATYLLYDERNNVLGEYTTNSFGLIELDGNIEPQKLKLKEIKSPDNYVLDSTVYEVEIKAGATAELTLKNEPMRGTIQIIKKSADANAITKQKAGALLEGAKFEILNEKNEVVDTITTDSRGVANSGPLPLAKYAIREIKSPDFFILDDSVFYAEIKLPGDVVKFEVLNNSADIAVSIDKRGDTEGKIGEIIRYDFTNVSNSGNIALDEFYLHDKLPAEVRLETLFTGTWSERLTYKVLYRTNLKTDYRVWQDKLLTTVNNELSVSDLKLSAKEYITDFKIAFGTVEPGFHEKEAPYITARVIDTLEHEYRIVNRADVGGKHKNEWVYDTDSWVTIAQAVPKKPLPKTGLQFTNTPQSLAALLPEKLYLKKK